MKKIRVLICDDHQIFIDGLISGLQDDPDIQVAGQASEGKTVLPTLGKVKNIDLILLDVEFPDADGIVLTQQIKAEFPHVRVIGLSMHDSATVIRKMIKAGADGYLIKNTKIEEIIEAVRQVHSGEKYFKGLVLDKIIEFSSDPEKERGGPSAEKLLTPREKQILRLIAAGKSNQQIANELFISVHTVNSHRKNMIKKLKLSNTAELVSFAYKNDLLGEND